MVLKKPPAGLRRKAARGQGCEEACGAKQRAIRGAEPACGAKQLGRGGFEEAAPGFQWGLELSKKPAQLFQILF